MIYLLLQHPGHNRVYYNASDKLALSELNIACFNMDCECENVSIIEIAGVRYLSFETESELSLHDLQMLSRLSFIFAFYRAEKNKEDFVLYPIQKHELNFIDDKISTMLKYRGKTNELFTRLMINIAMLSSDFSYGDKIKLIDPIAGRGTTLYEGLVYGMDVCGVELEKSSVDESVNFFKKFLQEDRIKFSFQKRRIAGANKAEAIFSEEFSYMLRNSDIAINKSFNMVCGNTLDLRKYFKAESFEIMVGDLPYGVVHGNVSSMRGNGASGKGRKLKKGGPTRNPVELLESALPAWYKVLKRGGVAVIAWNSFLIQRNELAKYFEAVGFSVLSGEFYDEFEHKVDRAIKRDILVAKKV